MTALNSNSKLPKINSFYTIYIILIASEEQLESDEIFSHVVLRIHPDFFWSIFSGSRILFEDHDFLFTYFFVKKEVAGPRALIKDFFTQYLP